MNSYLKCYPAIKKDRRQRNVFADFERRSGNDRRKSDERYCLDWQIQRDVVDIRNSVSSTTAAFCAIPHFKKIQSVVNAAQDGNITKLLGKAFNAVICMKKDSVRVWDTLKNPAKDNGFVEPSAFVRGTFLEKFKIFDKISNLDKSLFEMPFVDRLAGKLNVDIDIETTGKFNKLGKELFQYKIKGNAAKKIAFESLLRIPALTVPFLVALEAPAVIDADDKVGQSIKSTFNVGAMLLAAATFASIGARVNRIFALAGAGIGAYIGDQVTDAINEKF